MKMKIKTLYFSPTGTTEKIVKSIAEKIAQNYGGKNAVDHMDFTLPEARKKILCFDSEDLVVTGLPVYGGRTPVVLRSFLNTISGDGATAVAVVLYGNRDYEDALIELKDILESNGFNVIAAGAFIGEHSFSTVLGANRPDAQDMAVAADFAAKIVAKLKACGEKRALFVKGNRPYKEDMQVKEKAVNNGSVVQVVPKTNSECIDCKLCSEVCPMGAIDSDDVSKVSGICIKCCACVKKCPVGAKYFDDANYLRRKQELELKFSNRSPGCVNG